MLIIEFKEIPVRTVRRHISTGRISLGPLIDPLPVQPFIKGAGVIKHSVQYNLHTPPVNLFDQFDQQFITVLQVLRVSNPLYIF